MKRLQLLFLTAFFLFAFLTMSSDIKAQDMEVGISAGLNISSHLKDFRFSTQDINLKLEPEVALGYQGGLVVRKKITNSLRLQAEPSIILLGARYEEPITVRGFNFETDSRTELLYLQMPLILQVTTVPRKETVYGRHRNRTTYHLSGGIFGGYLLDAKFSGTNTGAPIGIDFEGDFSNDVTFQYKEYDGGLILGAGLEHGHNNKVGFETRAMFSILDSGNDQEPFFKPQNMAITFSVYFLL